MYILDLRNKLPEIEISLSPKVEMTRVGDFEDSLIKIIQFVEQKEKDINRTLVTYRALSER